MLQLGPLGLKLLCNGVQATVLGGESLQSLFGIRDFFLCDHQLGLLGLHSLTSLENGSFLLLMYEDCGVPQLLALELQLLNPVLAFLVGFLQRSVYVLELDIFCFQHNHLLTQFVRAFERH